MGHNAYLKQKFPRITDTKIKKGIFMGSQIIEITRESASDKFFLSEG